MTETKIIKKGNCYMVQVGKNFVSSPTNTITNNPEFAVCIDNKQEAEWLADYHSKHSAEKHASFR